jgi:hypothetical protein
MNALSNYPYPWFGVHVYLGEGPRDSHALAQALPKMRAVGINSLVVEVNYHYAYRSHPELSTPTSASRDDIRALLKAARQEGVRLVPQFNCLGHQSWAEHTFPLLSRYPEFDETPGQYPNNKDIYCRSWCPRHPQVNPIVFDLFDELIEVFEADALHVGMDEVFLIASEHCPRCRGSQTGEVFAEAVNAYHNFLVNKSGVEMLMWGDRLLDDRAVGYGEWESARNGTHTALPMVPRDIILCDWHYELMPDYPSIALLINEGFRVWPGGWRNTASTEALLACEQRYAGEKLLGHMCTTWGAVAIDQINAWPPVLAAARQLGFLK